LVNVRLLANSKDGKAVPSDPVSSDAYGQISSLESFEIGLDMHGEAIEMLSLAQIFDKLKSLTLNLESMVRRLPNGCVALRNSRALPQLQNICIRCCRLPKDRRDDGDMDEYLGEFISAFAGLGHLEKATLEVSGDLQRFIHGSGTKTLVNSVLKSLRLVIPEPKNGLSSVAAENEAMIDHWLNRSHGSGTFPRLNTLLYSAWMNLAPSMFAGFMLVAV
jgi:hypothetical protein